MTEKGETAAPIAIEPVVIEAAHRLEDGDAQGALALIEPLVADDNATLPARFVLALTAWKIGRFDWAVDVMKECHERWPMDGTVAEALASLYAQVGNLVESLYMAKIGTALGGPNETLASLAPMGFPTFNWAFRNIKERPFLAAAKSGLAAGRIDEAIEKARQHLVFEGPEPEGLRLYASALLRVGRPSTAVKALGAIAGEAEPQADLAGLHARALAGVGELEAARRWHDKATQAAPADALLAAARVADGYWFEPDAAQLAEAASRWIGRFCPASKPRQVRDRGESLVIGYLVRSLADPLDAAAVAAVARAHDRARVKVVGYGTGAQSWKENAEYGSAFDVWHDVGGLDGPTLARFFPRDGVDAVVDACGFAAPEGVLALARLASAVRIAWLGMPAMAPGGPYDARIEPESAPDAEFRWRIAGGYPVLPPLRRLAPAERGAVQFGADVRLPQLDDETVAAWSAILDALPDARLVLRAHDMGPDTVDRLIARFGRDLAARIDMVAAARPEEFYCRVDVALAPRRGLSARMAAEAVGCLVPTVAFSGAGACEPYGGFLCGLGLAPSLVANDRQDYVAIAASLACSEELRRRAAEAMAAAPAVGEDGARSFARAIEERLTALLGAAVAA